LAISQCASSSAPSFHSSKNLFLLNHNFEIFTAAFLPPSGMIPNFLPHCLLRLWPPLKMTHSSPAPLLFQ
jgi:hypothetical protein